MPCSVKDMGTAIMMLQQPKVSIRTGMGAVSPTARRGRGRGGEARWPHPSLLNCALLIDSEEGESLASVVLPLMTPPGSIPQPHRRPALV